MIGLISRIAKQVGISEEELIALMQEMLSAGLIRQSVWCQTIMPEVTVLTLMTVWDVDDQDILSLGETVGQLILSAIVIQRPRQERRLELPIFCHGARP